MEVASPVTTACSVPTWVPSTDGVPASVVTAVPTTVATSGVAVDAGAATAGAVSKERVRTNAATAHTSSSLRVDPNGGTSSFPCLIMRANSTSLNADIFD